MNLTALVTQAREIFTNIFIPPLFILTHVWIQGRNKHELPKLRNNIARMRRIASHGQRTKMRQMHK